jgi:hypothetical protein
MLDAYRSGDGARARAQAQALCGIVPANWCAFYQSASDRFAEVTPAQDQPGTDTVRILASL